uniref:RING-type E3 ubiquitin transferase n=1 Tax=Kalanchoe fedtschenkoi TaxID=63787 RepID=A0A7N0SZR9_KALFE
MVKFSLTERDSAAEGEPSSRKAKRARVFSDEDDDDEDFNDFFNVGREDETGGSVNEVGDKEAAGVGKQAGASSSRDGSISVILTDPEVLDCTICYDSLKIPVFQCENGHIACSSCCTRIKNKCPSCSFPIGYNRCRAIEKVIESVKVLCQNSLYGCSERPSLNVRKDHEDKCIHTPSTCPISGCSFLGSCQQLSRHCSARHSASVKRFQYNHLLSFSLEKDCRIIILQEEKEGALFILNNASEMYGNVVTVKYIGPLLSKRILSYDLLARQDINTLRLQSFMENHSALVGVSSCFLIVPHAFFNSSRLLKMELCIRLANLS